MVSGDLEQFFEDDVRVHKGESDIKELLQLLKQSEVVFAWFSRGLSERFGNRAILGDSKVAGRSHWLTLSHGVQDRQYIFSGLNVMGYNADEGQTLGFVKVP